MVYYQLVLNHYPTWFISGFHGGQDGDPDLLERNSQDWNKAERLILPFVSMLLWKWAYYAPNTYKDRVEMG